MKNLLRNLNVFEISHSFFSRCRSYVLEKHTHVADKTQRIGLQAKIPLLRWAIRVSVWRHLREFGTPSSSQAPNFQISDSQKVTYRLETERPTVQALQARRTARSTWSSKVDETLKRRLPHCPVLFNFTVSRVKSNA